MMSRWRRPKNHVVKGAPFPSHKKQLDSEPRRQWISHLGARQRLRALRITCKDILDSTDEDVQHACARVVASVRAVTIQHVEYNILLLVSAALGISADTGQSFVESITYLMDQFDAKEADRKAQITPDAQPPEAQA